VEEVVPTLVISSVMEVVEVMEAQVIHLTQLLLEWGMVLVGVVHLIQVVPDLKEWEVLVQITPEAVEVEVVQECHQDLVGLEDQD
jgi:hypothetical protein